jgi:hypothetical protein
MEPKVKKIAKLLSLLVSSLLIAAASADVYNYMFMNATVGTKTTGMRFVEGTNFADAGGQLLDNNQRVTFSKMNGTIGQLTNYSDPVNIQNNDQTNHVFELVLDSWTGGSQTKLYNITITMYESTTQKGNSIVLVPGEGEGHVTTSGEVTIGPSTTWRVEWLVYWSGNALETDYVQVYLKLVIKS